MLQNIKKLTNDQIFIIISLILSLLLSFMFGYTVFRYWQIEVCKSPMEVGDFSDPENLVFTNKTHTLASDFKEQSIE